MLVLFLRHADAEPRLTGDSLRRLTDKGIGQAERMADFLPESQLHPEVIFSSPLVRARQTAEIVGKRLGIEPVEARWLASGMTPDACMSELEACVHLSTVLLVGHEPDFSNVIAAWIGCETSENLHIRKTSLTALDVSGCRPGAARLEFLIPVRYI